MRLLVVLEHRFDATPDGAVWSSGPYGRRFWDVHRTVFENIVIVARVRSVATPAEGAIRSDGETVEFGAVPHYIGPGEYVRRAQAIRRAARAAFRHGDAVVLRAPSQLANVVHAGLPRSDYPYAVRVVGDPWDVFAPGAVRHPLRPLLRWWFPRELRRLCRGACAVGYVTERVLAQRYPPAPSAFALHYSDAELPDVAFAPVPRASRPGRGPWRLLMVASLAQMYKAPDVLLHAIALCSRGGIELTLRIVGEGRHRAEMERLAGDLGIGSRVSFAGSLLAGERVRAELDAADLFVLPSRTEGLPRAMLEAMARGLPCIGSSAGGIPELLSPEDIVPPGDVAVLAAKLREVLADPDRMGRMSSRNLDRAREYASRKLAVKRVAFYTELRARTEAWLREGVAE